MSLKLPRRDEDLDAWVASYLDAMPDPSQPGWQQRAMGKSWVEVMGALPKSVTLSAGVPRGEYTRAMEFVRAAGYTEMKQAVKAALWQWLVRQGADADDFPELSQS